jgi:hypothetical protein
MEVPSTSVESIINQLSLLDIQLGIDMSKANQILITWLKSWKENDLGSLTNLNQANVSKIDICLNKAYDIEDIICVIIWQTSYEVNTSAGLNEFHDLTDVSLRHFKEYLDEFYVSMGLVD